jgi:hypothetical protein
VQEEMQSGGLARERLAWLVYIEGEMFAKDDISACKA